MYKCINKKRKSFGNFAWIDPKMYTPYPDSESLKTLNGQATSDHACTLNFPIQLYQIQEPESRATTNVHRPLDRALLLAVTAAGVAMALHRRDVLVVHRGELRVAVPRRSDSVAPKHITEGEEDESKELEVGELLGALLRGARMAVDVAVGVTRAPGGEHGTVERERRLVEPEPLQRDEDARGEVHREARRQERAQDGGGDAERHEDDEEVVVVAFETHVRRGVEVEEHQLRRERRRRYQAECAVGQREVPVCVHRRCKWSKWQWAMAVKCYQIHWSGSTTEERIKIIRRENMNSDWVIQLLYYYTWIA